MLLNTQSPIPLYRQLADRILLDIDAGVHEVASRIPSEHELADTYEIGRPTVRQATDLLVRQGRLERRRGSGTYVLPASRSIDLFSLAGTSAALGKSELNAKLTLIRGPVVDSDFAEVLSPAIAAGAQNRDQSTENQVREDRIRIERCASVDDIPVLYETLWFSSSLFPGIENKSLDQSISALVRSDYFLEPTSAEQTFYAITATAAHARQLNIKEGDPLLRVFRQLHFGENRGALHAEIICLTDRFEFSQTLYPARADQDTTARFG